MHLPTTAMIGAVALALVSAAPGAHSQTVPVRGTTPTLSANDLVNRASVAQQAKGSVRISSVSVNRTSGSSIETIRSHGITSFRDQRYAFKSTDHTVILDVLPHRVSDKRRQEVLVDPVLAKRTSHGSWHCQNIQAMEASASDLLTVIKSSGGLSVQYGAVIGTEINGTPVWDVPLMVAPPGSTTNGLVLKEHLFVSQADYTVVRDITSTVLNISLRQHGKDVHLKNTQTTTTNYTEYGVPVSVSLPAACAGVSLRAFSVKR